MSDNDGAGGGSDIYYNPNANKSGEIPADFSDFKSWSVSEFARASEKRHSSFNRLSAKIAEVDLRNHQFVEDMRARINGLETKIDRLSDKLLGEQGGDDGIITLQKFQDEKLDRLMEWKIKYEATQEAHKNEFENRIKMMGIMIPALFVLLVEALKAI